MACMIERKESGERCSSDFHYVDTIYLYHRSRVEFGRLKSIHKTPVLKAHQSTKILETENLAPFDSSPLLLDRSVLPSPGGEEADSESVLAHAVRSIWHGDPHSETTNYAVGGLKTAALFCGSARGELLGKGAGWGLAATAILYGLDRVTTRERGRQAASDFVWGCAEGATTRVFYCGLGKLGVQNAAAKGILQGIGNRSLHSLTTAGTYRDARGKGALAIGLATAASTTFDSRAMATDAALFIVAHGTIRGFNQLSGGAVEARPLLSNVVTSGSFGLSSGAYSELSRQRMRGNEIHWVTVCKRALIEGGVDSLAGLPGGALGETRLATRVLPPAELNKAEMHKTDMNKTDMNKTDMNKTHMNKTEMTEAEIENTESESKQTEAQMQTFAPAEKKNQPQPPADLFPDITNPTQKAKMIQAVEAIHEKFKGETVSKEDLKNIIESMPDSDRRLALEILSHCRANSSEAGVYKQLTAIASQIEADPQTSKAVDVASFTHAPGSAGRFLGYLFSKKHSTADGGRLKLETLDELQSDADSSQTERTAPLQDKTIVLFDDLSSIHLSPEALNTLRSVGKVHVVDLNAFEKGINLLDFAQGQQAVKTKLTALVCEAKVMLQQSPPSISTQQVMDHLFNKAVDKAARSIGTNVQIVRPAVAEEAPSSMPPNAPLMDQIDALHSNLNQPKATIGEIAAYLRQQPAEDREATARLLTEMPQVFSLKDMFGMARELHQRVTETMLKSDQGASRIYIDGVAQGSSQDMVAHIYQRANKLTGQDILTRQEQRKLTDQNQAGDKTLLRVDDAFYTGSSQQQTLTLDSRRLQGFGGVIAGGLAAMRNAELTIRAAQGISRLSVVSARALPWCSELRLSDAECMPTKELNKYNRLLGETGYRHFHYDDNRQEYSSDTAPAAIIWPHSVPDNNLELFRKFAHEVLHLQYVKPCPI
jgi:hypothetical protein